MTTVDIESDSQHLLALAHADNGVDVDEAETEEAEEDVEDDDDVDDDVPQPSSVLGKRLNGESNGMPDGKRLRQSTEDNVIDLGDEEEDEEDADDDEDDDTDSSAHHRPYSKNGSKQFMSKGNRSAGQFQQGNEPTSQQNSNLQHLLDSMDRKTKSELFSDALETCGAELFQGHESWRDQLLIKACRLHPAFVSSINELAHQSGSYNTPVVLSGDEDDDDDDDGDDEADDDEVDSSHSGGADNDVGTQSGDDDDDDGLALGDDDDLELGELTDLVDG
ncbi:Aste57867_20606 [Aphanomyces stellatus]|uniref:Aste57867_20606 protein n=1 Tax=Aphanomyces stellatus TaxID=120398 RepID=A0A485LG17_9STRA|nr:hypothetical protein As57867_020538 [Aphanomyces stellatus]VFT97286.1 Aste57867_20606 [Aphanomyces stellatus]